MRQVPAVAELADVLGLEVVQAGRGALRRNWPWDGNRAAMMGTRSIRAVTSRAVGLLPEAGSARAQTGTGPRLARAGLAHMPGQL